VDLSFPPLIDLLEKTVEEYDEEDSEEEEQEIDYDDFFNDE